MKVFISFRLKSTADWAPEDAALLLEYYQQCPDTEIKREIATNKNAAGMMLATLKKRLAELRIEEGESRKKEDISNENANT